MYKIEDISADALQKQTFVLPDKTRVQLTLYFSDTQYGWFIKELVYGEFVLNGLRVCNSPNILHQWRNQIPFGLACTSLSKREPMFIEDFSTNANELFILTSEEVNQFYEVLVNG